jgi:FKBP-type peptidyl-prolyl cis-trans isomerase
MKTLQILLAPLLATLVLAGCSKPADTTSTSSTAAATTSGPASTVPAVSTSTNGLTATASGLQYEVIKHGTGTVSPKSTDTVKVDYTGVLLNGNVFDSSIARGEPAVFRLDQVIPGWTEGLQLMKVGDRFRFVIPANLAYGTASPSPDIPPNSTLVFQVDLLAIQ